MNLPVYGTGDTTGSHFFVYDNGGPSGNYAANSNGSYTFHTSNPANHWQILVHSNVPSNGGACVASLKVSDGLSTMGNLYNNNTFANRSNRTPYLYNYFTQSNGNTVTIHFSSDCDTPNEGFEIELCEVGCYDGRARDITARMLDTNDERTGGTVRLSWSGGSGPWMIVLCYNCDFGEGGGLWGNAVTLGGQLDTLYTDNNYYDFPGYLFNTIYSIFIKPLCEAECGGYGEFFRLLVRYIPPCNCDKPTMINYRFEGDTIIFTWSGSPAVRYWYFAEESLFRIDTLIHGNELRLYWDHNDRCHSTAVVVSSCDPLSDTACLVESAPVYGCQQAPGLRYVIVGDSVRLFWNAAPEIYYWSIICGDWDTVLPASATSFTLLDTGYCTRTRIRVCGNCTFGAGCNPDNFSVLDIDHTSCANIIGGPYLVNSSGDRLDIGWTDGASEGCHRYVVTAALPSAPDSIVASDTVRPGVGLGVLRGLSEVTQYLVTIHSICCGGKLSCTSASGLFYTSLNGCLDYINFNDRSLVSLTTGTYDDPGIRLSQSFYGDFAVTRNGPYRPYFIGSPSHAVMYDTAAFDPLTGNRLRVVPPGMKASMRLGNTGTGALAESIAYTLYVDSNVNDLLVLRYAIVMQNPGHTPANQPNFTLEILDQRDSLIDNVCGYSSFIPSEDLQDWNATDSGAIQWKDWTSVGIRIGDYHGQRIRVRFTNRDCAEGGHWAYSYLTLDCSHHRIDLLTRCDGSDSVLLTAPEGFLYEWHREGEDTVLSTNRSVTVPADSSAIYQCLCTFPGITDCGVTLESYVVRIRLVADMEVIIDTCRQVITAVNHSRIDYDTTHHIVLSQYIDTLLWRVDGQEIPWRDTVRIPLTGNGTHHISLYTHLSESECRDSIGATIPIGFYQERDLLGDSNVCPGGTTTLRLHLSPISPFHWHTGSDSISFTLTPKGDSLVWVAYRYLHCADTLRRTVRVRPEYDDTLRFDACRGFRFDSLGFHESETGLYTFHKLSQYLCDSLFTLDLRIHPVYDDTLRVTTCDTPWGGHDSTGLYTEHLLTRFGCDSLRTLSLLRKKASIWGDLEACEGDTIHLYATDLTSEGALYLWQAGGSAPEATFSAQARRSPYLLDIYVNDTCQYHLAHPVAVYPLFDDTLVVDLCHGWFDSLGFLAYDDGLYTLALSSLHGCDSLSTLLLTRRPNYYDTLVVRTCGLPYADAEWDVDSTGFYVHLYPTSLYGCDSLFALDFIRHPLFLDTLVEQIFFGDTYTGHGFRTGEEGFYERVYTDSYGCDSTYRLDLTVLDLRFPNTVTPNGDGVNDRFLVHDLTRAWVIDHADLWIYDRNGRLVFHQTHFSQSTDYWNPNATHSPDGTYFFRFHGRSLSKSIDRTGVIEVLRTPKK